MQKDEEEQKQWQCHTKILIPGAASIYSMYIVYYYVHICSSEYFCNRFHLVERRKVYVIVS